MYEQDLDQKIRHWQDQLLDLGKRNKMISFRDTRRSTLRILSPDYEELYRRVVVEEEELTFQKAIDRDSDARIYSILTLMDQLSAPMEVTIGDIRAQGALSETAKTLKNLRDKARLALNEQGTNILHLVFGFLQWRERSGKGDGWVRSPLILVPVTLLLPTLNGQFSLKKHEDEVTVNPTLAYLLQRDYGITLPDFDPDSDSLSRYLRDVENLVNDRGWRVIPDCSLGLVSFQKITMYQDLIRNEEDIRSNPIILALAGVCIDTPQLAPEESELPSPPDFDHDRQSSSGMYQVLDADSSQQDAITLSRSGESFVMQGPPGTGKSQTITNIIAQALADGKTVLFVSEKMAALEVVYNRLADVQLGDFCLNLHSHKVNKKEILTQLGNNLELPRRKVKDEELAKLTRLDLIRQQLKAYVDDIHAPVSPLDMSLYEVYGAIYSRRDLPDLEADHPDVQSMTKDRLNRRLLLLNGLENALLRMDPPPAENPWTGLSCSYLTPSGKRHTGDRLRNVIQGLKTLEDCSVGGRDLTDLVTANNLDALMELQTHAPFCKALPADWFGRNTGEELSAATLCADLGSKIQSHRDKLQQDWGRDCLDLLDSPHFARFREDAPFLFTLRNPGESGSPRPLTDPESTLKEMLEKGRPLRDCLDRIQQIRTKYRILPEVTDDQFSELLQKLRRLVPTMDPQPGWAGADTMEEDLLRELITRQTLLRKTRTRILEQWEDTVFNLPYEEMLDRFKADYTSPLRFLNTQYREDIRRVRVTSRSVRRIGEREVVELLETLHNHGKELRAYEAMTELCEDMLEVPCKAGLSEDWAGLQRRLSGFLQLRAFFTNPEDAVQFVRHGVREELVAAFTEKDRLQLWFRPRNVQILLTALEQLLALDTLLHQRKEAVADARARMPELFSGPEPVWDTIVTSIEHQNRMKEILDQVSLDDHLRLWLTGQISGCRPDRYRSRLLKFLPCRDDLGHILSMFSAPEGLGDLPLKALALRLERCQDHLTRMDLYIDYREALNSCREEGLDVYLSRALTCDLPERGLAETYLKSFYYAWFEAVSGNFPSVARFRVHSHNENVETFRALDAHRLPVNRMRIRERLIRDMPRKDQLSHGSDEMSVLLHELGKKRNIMPLRRLFRTIPNLLLRLKPCLMMSPLSVAHFLEAQTYKFDMVIFDEASQIFPQDAIGAIFRASQVIITGDSKQLPPTNFFAVTNSNVSQPIDDEAWDQDIYDSILEEAACNLPNRSLLWHYRSRYEDLISFSNREIYQNRLITFPSSVTKMPDTGVEYVHVPGGIYDNRCNAAEARRIMELVAEHIRDHPDRSLGIIAFSESQQSLIEDRINAFRTLNPALEWFFDENRDEPFFVKNLENVQGDERDTILFSICYGKNPQGKMYMRFGPLGAAGGERRLNVAITRAKLNIKLVGSILPEDLDLSKTDAEGVRMLRDYIRFAMAGTSHSDSSLRARETDRDAFCEEVGKYLTSMGCRVHMHVGSSDYTVDIAVEHPARPGRYIAGIECDGNSYRMARTVQDRDRLRTAVLERMGWKMYRIWSTEWIRNPEAEQDRLMAFLRQAMLDDGNTVPEKKSAPDPEVGTEDAGPISGGTADNPYNLPLYEEFDCTTITVESGGDPWNRLETQARAVIQAEQPIHMDLLYRRLSVCFPAGKVTPKVRNTVDELIRLKLTGDTVTEDGFIRFRDYTDIRPRMSPTGNPHRTIDHISIPEISAAVVRVLHAAYGITPAALYNEVAGIFGYERIGPKIRKRAENALNALIARGSVSLRDGKLQLLEDQP